MNVKNMTALRDHLVWLLENGKESKFAMGLWLGYKELEDMSCSIEELEDLGYEVSPYECGTIGCVAGHAAMLSGRGKAEPVWEAAAVWLDLTDDQANYIFFTGDAHSGSLRAVIKHLDKILLEGFPA